tara:strand:- start:593 stop:2425 length:1833 start_codon:yes stop_codon:yes gene_type:complete
MSGFWKNDDKIKVSQTQVAITSTNGRSYTGTAGQSGRRVDFEIPSTVKFMDGKNSYLNFDVKLAIGAIPTRLQLDPTIGGQSLIKNIRIYSGSRAVLLEEISDYNAKVQIQYSYDADESIRKMRALKEGCLVTTVEQRGTLGTSVSNNIDIRSNPYYSEVATVPALRDWGSTADFVACKCSLPIHSGLFADSSKIFPVLMTDGLFLEIDLEDPARCIKQLDSVNRNRRLAQNPVFHGIDAAGTAMVIDNAANLTEIFLGKQNHMTSVANCPFVKGEQVGVCDITDPTSQAALTTTAGGGAGGTQLYPIITDITMDGGFVKLTLGEFQNSNVGTGIGVVTNDFVLFSAAVDQFRLATVGGATLIPKLTLYDAALEVSDMELVVQQVAVDPRYEAGMMKKMREGGSIDIDIKSVTNYKHSLLKSNRNATVNLAVSNTRAKSMLVMATDASTLDTADLIGGLSATYLEEEGTMDTQLHSIRSGQVGVIDQLTNYQFVIDDKLVPSRPIVVSKINKGVSISAQPLIELEKALNQSGIVPRSFVDYNRNFIIGRAYALNDGVANLNNKSNQLQLFYNESSVTGVDRPPLVDKLLFAFLFHVRRISIKGDSVSVML